MVISQYAFEGRRLDLDGIGYHYLDEGSGPPVVMVHGNPTWSFYYRRLVTELRDSYRCIVPDHIGCGRSDKPNDSRYDYHFTQRAADLGQLIDSLNLDEPVTLIVHDWGGMIGMRWATLNPDKVARLVVLNTAAFPLPKSKRFPLGLALARSNRLGAMLVRGLNLFGLTASYIGCQARLLDDATREAYLEPYDSWETRRAVHRFVQDIPLKPGDRGYEDIQDVADKLAQFRDRPMQLFWGLRDFVFDRHFLAEWQERFPDAESHVYPECGHYILEDAHQEIVPAVREFLDRHTT